MMTIENQKRCEEKSKRIKDALALKEPDRVPIQIHAGTYMIAEAGYTVAEVNYDTSLEKAKDATIKFLKKYDPDVLTSLFLSFAGEGPLHEAQGLSTLFIAGMQNTPIRMPEMSGPQFWEQVMLKDEEMEMFTHDYTQWGINKYMPRISSLLAPFADFKLPLHHRNINDIITQFSRPAIKEAIQKMWELDEQYKAYFAKLQKVDTEIAESLGFPALEGGARAVVPFDKYSDTFRGFIHTLTDIYDYEEEMLTYMERYQKENIQGIWNANKDGSRTGRYMSMALHKGFDGMLNDAQYEKYYWRHLKECIEEGKKAGFVPSVFCEGKYMSRLKYLTDITPGNVLYTFEEMDMAATKKALAGKACVGGGFPTSLLIYASKERVVDEVKRMLDDCAPGGGYIFGLSAGLGPECKVENVEAMFDTVRTYGKY